MGPKVYWKTLKWLKLSLLCIHFLLLLLHLYFYNFLSLYSENTGHLIEKMGSLIWERGSMLILPPVPKLTVSFLGSRSRSRRSREVLTFRASDRAISPPVLISFSRRSRRRSRGLSAMNSATATAPKTQMTQRDRRWNIQDGDTSGWSRGLTKVPGLHLHRRVWWKRGPVWAQSGWRWVRLSACGRLHCPPSYGRGWESPDSECRAERGRETRRKKLWVTVVWHKQAWRLLFYYESWVFYLSLITISIQHVCLIVLS